MTEVAGYHRQDLSIDQRLALRTAATRLGEEFAAIYGPETIERFLHSSYDQFATGATVPNFLPLLAERFARQRLTAAARLDGHGNDGRPVVLFLCVHNAGRNGAGPGGRAAARPARADGRLPLRVDVGRLPPLNLSDERVEGRAADRGPGMVQESADGEFGPVEGRGCHGRMRSCGVWTTSLVERNRRAASAIVTVSPPPPAVSRKPVRRSVDTRRRRRVLVLRGVGLQQLGQRVQLAALVCLSLECRRYSRSVTRGPRRSRRVG